MGSIDLTQIHGLGPYSALRIVAECGTDRTRWPTVKHFTSWLTLAPGSKSSGGKVLSSKTRRSSNRATSLFRIAAIGVGKTSTAMGAFFRRLAARVGKAKAVTATARKIAVLFYNTLCGTLRAGGTEEGGMGYSRSATAFFVPSDGSVARSRIGCQPLSSPICFFPLLSAGPLCRARLDRNHFGTRLCVRQPR